MSPARIRLGIIATIAVWSLLTGGSIAEAQAQNQRDRPGISSHLNLTMEQRHIIKEIIKGLKIENEPRNIQLVVGQIIPKTILLRAMPLDISQKVSQVKNHVFFLKNDRVVLVDPKNNKVVDIIELQ